MRIPGYLNSLLETDLTEDILLTPGIPQDLNVEGIDITFSAPLLRKKPLGGLFYFEPVDEATEKNLYFRLRFYGGEVIRLKISKDPGSFVDDSPMLSFDTTLAPRQAFLYPVQDGWVATDGSNASFSLDQGPFAPRLSPDGQVEVAFQGADQFMPNLRDALPAFRLERADSPVISGFALHALPGEHFAGAGEQFKRTDLFGQRLELVNSDALGVNNSRAYKNIPFLLSSRAYGLFVHSSAKMKLDVGAQSTRSIQWLCEDDAIDLFLIGGGNVKRVLYNYCRLTGFPPMPPVWSFGVWMSRATYYSDDEVSAVARRLRQEGYPCDVLHLDTGWFKREWVCDWMFNPDTFPDPPEFMQSMKQQGFRVCLWQTPHVHPESRWAEEAVSAQLAGRETDKSKRHWLGYTLDFTNPAAVVWYKDRIRTLLRLGAAVIKADFGEEIDEGAVYQGVDARKYHNLFGLLYQKAAFEVTREINGARNALIWARAGWAGCQRYPLHWGGDAASTYDGLAGTILGGLSAGLSGLVFWSHDVGGIHGIPDFFKSRPSEDLYLRWTQVGVFSSHMRFHGATPREPWEYPGVAEHVRQWLRMRYALLPYILKQSQACTESGLPMLRSLVFDWPDDPAVWSITDQYLFGDAFLVCPVTNEAGVRDVYLPDGVWVDFWSGQQLQGPCNLLDIHSPVQRLPLFVRMGSTVRFAEPVEHTGQLPETHRVDITFNESYPGFEATPLKLWINL